MRIIAISLLAGSLFAGTITVTVRDKFQPEIVTETLPIGVLGLSYSTQLMASVGKESYEWSIYSGSIGGLTLSPSGLLSGIPTTIASAEIAFQVKDSMGLVTRKILVHTVTDDPIP